MTHNSMIDLTKTATQCEAGQPERRLLECLERPDFFNGQHLTDEDLDAIVQWTRGRLRLERLREGWGVVCGLNVSVDTKNAHRPVLRVSPGYAVDGCGEDIVACDELCLSISKKCATGVKLAQPAMDTSDSLNAWRSIHESFDEDWNWDDKNQNLRAVDLYVCFHETQARPTLKRSCSPHGNRDCDYGRWRESASLKVEPATDPCPDSCTTDTAGFNDYLRLISEFEDFIKGLPKDEDGLPKDGEKIRKWFLNQIDGRNQSEDLKLFGQRIPFVRNWVAQLTDQEFKVERLQVRILYYLIIELRLQHLAKQCPTNSEPCVRLARVWLYVSGNADCCDVIGIDTDPPYRREFGLDEEQCLHNRFNLGQLFWIDYGDATMILSDLGVDADFVEFNIAGNPASLKEQLRVEDLCASDEVILQYDPYTERVVGFGPERPVAVDQDGEGDGEAVERAEITAANTAADETDGIDTGAGGNDESLGANAPEVTEQDAEGGPDDATGNEDAVDTDADAEVQPGTADVGAQTPQDFVKLLMSDQFKGIKAGRALAMVNGAGIATMEQLSQLTAEELKEKMKAGAQRIGVDLGVIREYEEWIETANQLVAKKD